MNDLEYWIMMLTDMIQFMAHVLVLEAEDFISFLVDTFDPYCCGSPAFRVVSGITWLELRASENLRFCSAVAWQMLRDNYKGKKCRLYRKAAYGCCCYFYKVSERFENDLMELGWQLQ